MKQPQSIPRGRGRPSKKAAEDLSDLIVETALAGFRKWGFEGTSIDAIADNCKASKHTIYRRFASKEALFIAAVGRDRQAILDRFAAVDISERDTLSALRETCAALFEIAVSPGSTDLYRMCIGAVPKFPLIGAQFAESEKRIQDILEPLVVRAQGEGILTNGDPRRLSGQLYYATIGEIWGHALMGLSYVDDRAARASLFEANWLMFLNGHRQQRARPLVSADAAP